MSDHDVFGTHENDEDSMDSLVLRDDVINDEDDSPGAPQDSLH